MLTVYRNRCELQEEKTKLENRDFQRVNIKHTHTKTQTKQGSLSVKKASKQKRENLYIFEYTQQKQSKWKLQDETSKTKQTCVKTKQTKDDVIC